MTDMRTPPEDVTGAVSSADERAIGAALGHRVDDGEARELLLSHDNADDREDACGKPLRGQDLDNGQRRSTRDGSSRLNGAHAWRRPNVVVPGTLLLVFVVMLWMVATRPTVLTHFDTWARDAVQRRSHASDHGAKHWLWVRWVSDLGGTFPAVPAMGVVAAAFAAIRRSWRPIVAALAAYAVLGGAVAGLKVGVGRPGPGQGSLTGLLGYFPSGHTANTLMCYGTCALILAAGLDGSRTGRGARFIIAAAMVLVAVAVGISLVWLDYHWVSDVLGSYALCGAALYGIAAILRTDRTTRITQFSGAASPTALEPASGTR
jgi:membrane-associated phospholipid phosphatase